jgi:hypothetical protein
MFSQNANEIVPSPKAYIPYKAYTTLHTLHPQKATSTANDEEKPPRGPAPPRGFFYFPPTHQNGRPASSQRPKQSEPPSLLPTRRRRSANAWFTTRRCVSCTAKKRNGHLVCNGLPLPSFPSEPEITTHCSPTVTVPVLRKKGMGASPAAVFRYLHSPQNQKSARASHRRRR